MKFKRKELDMTVPSLFKEYIWLVNTILRARRITFAEIQERWLDTEMSGGVEFARSTFNRHKDAIEDIFGIYIECDRKGGYKYYIGNENVMYEDTVENWIVSTMSVNDIIADSRALHDRIVLQRIPCDDYLQTFINAMKRKVRVAVKYRRYESDSITEVDFEPYCLKLFNQRWYVLAHFHRDADGNGERDYFGVYSFDRIQDISLTDVKFEVREDFDAQKFFGECFGVVVGDGTPAERIILRAYGKQRYYLNDLPLHHSQKAIGQGENYTDFEYFVRPTCDFCGHVLSLGNQLKVIYPQSLADRISGMAVDTLKMYGIDVKNSAE
ncbi:MAG: WYL domain-containing protein [Bacteroidaceae bacterium]|nr:WYL domain-containing protein [Bacteroidaceae bacterium]